MIVCTDRCTFSMLVVEGRLQIVPWNDVLDGRYAGPAILASGREEPRAQTPV
jgi:hypothetical protein